jgi:hypothetical protein
MQIVYSKNIYLYPSMILNDSMIHDKDYFCYPV